MTNLTSVLNFSDAIVFLIAIPNIIGLYLFAPEVKREVNAYLDKLKSIDEQKRERSSPTTGRETV